MDKIRSGYALHVLVVNVILFDFSRVSGDVLPEK